jgi:hypothetical protein
VYHCLLFFSAKIHNYSDNSRHYPIANFSKVAGATLLVRFLTGNTAPFTTLNVSGTGAHSIVFHGKILEDGVVKAGETYLFVFDGSVYQIVGESEYTYSAANAALATANSAASTANSAKTTANEAKTTANEAKNHRK